MTAIDGAGAGTALARDVALTGGTARAARLERLPLSKARVRLLIAWRGSGASTISAGSFEPLASCAVASETTPDKSQIRQIAAISTGDRCIGSH
jgi:hypothetical protein